MEKLPEKNYLKDQRSGIYYTNKYTVAPEHGGEVATRNLHLFHRPSAWQYHESSRRASPQLISTWALHTASPTALLVGWALWPAHKHSGHARYPQREGETIFTTSWCSCWSHRQQVPPSTLGLKVELYGLKDLFQPNQCDDFTHMMYLCVIKTHLPQAGPANLCFPTMQSCPVWPRPSCTALWRPSPADLCGAGGQAKSNLVVLIVVLECCCLIKANRVKFSKKTESSLSRWI